jgi:hypothetical protein
MAKFWWPWALTEEVEALKKQVERFDAELTALRRHVHDVGHVAAGEDKRTTSGPFPEKKP